MPVFLTTVAFQSKYFLASETAQRHVAEIVERDTREMEPLLQMEEKALKGVTDITKYDTKWHQFYRHMGIISDSWNDSVNNSGSTNYPECFTLIEERKVIMDTFDTILRLVSSLIEVDIVEGLATIEELKDYLEDFSVSDSTRYFDSRLNQICGWRKDFSEIVHEKAQVYKAYITKGRFSLLQLEIPLLRYYTRAIIVKWNNTFDVEQYLAGNITKQHLAEQFLSAKNIHRREYLSECIDVMEDMMDQYLNQLYLSWDYMLEGYVPLLGQNPVIIINDSNIQHLHMVPKALTNDWLARFARERRLSNMIDHIAYQIEWGIVDDTEDNVTKPLLARQQQWKIVETNLREYQDSIKMDSQFYV